jgi:hypothetical protein
MPNRYRALHGLTLLLVIGAFGCAEESSLEIRARASLTDSAEIAGIRLQVDGRTIEASSFSTRESGPPAVSMEVPSSGTLTVYVQLIQDGETVAEGNAAWGMREGYEWGLDLFRQVDDPSDTCFGCSGHLQIEIVPGAQNTPGESIWLAWGGVEKGSGIVY